MEEISPSLPIPISAIGGRYLLFDIDAISWLRRRHGICGVYIGTLPQNPSQNVFMGLPMQLMPEEAQLLIELGVGYVLDDAQAHDVAMAAANADNRRQYLRDATEQMQELSAAKARSKEVDKKKALRKAKEKAARKATSAEIQQTSTAETLLALEEDEESLFSPAVPATDAENGLSQSGRAELSNLPQLSLTPTSSALLTAPTSVNSSAYQILPGLSLSSYGLYKHLHSRSYFHTPGLRFGSQFSVYPGDPLRFHAHFLAIGLDWEQEIDLMDIVGGGRLGTGVKKGYLFGAREPIRENRARDSNGIADERVRSFSIEWAAM